MHTRKPGCYHHTTKWAPEVDESCYSHGTFRDQKDRRHQKKGYFSECPSHELIYPLACFVWKSSNINFRPQLNLEWMTTPVRHLGSAAKVSARVFK